MQANLLHMQVANRRRGSKHAFLGESIDDNRSSSIGSFTALVEVVKT